VAERPDIETHWKLMMDRDFIGAADLRGQDRTLTIKSVTAGDLPIPDSKKTQRKPVISFEETPKKLALNSTNGKTIAALYGPLTVAWAGKRVTLFPTTAKFKGKEVEAVRIRDVVPAPKGQKSAPPPRDAKPDFEREVADLRQHLDAPADAPPPGTDEGAAS
jgi:hypothetical protein